MKKFASNIFVALFILCFASSENFAENDTELNVYTGLFDFNDHKQKAGLVGLQHQNEELYRR